MVNSESEYYLFEKLVNDLYSTSTKAQVLSTNTIVLPSNSQDQILGKIGKSVTLSTWSFEEMFPSNSIESVIGTNVLCKGDYVLVVICELVQNVSCDVWKKYIPCLYIATLITIDHPVSLMYETAKLLLINLVYCSIENQFTQGNPITHLYKQFKETITKSKNKPLWSYITTDDDYDKEALLSDKSSLKDSAPLLQATKRKTLSKNDKTLIEEKLFTPTTTTTTNVIGNDDHVDHQQHQSVRTKMMQKMISISLSMFESIFPNIKEQLSMEALQVASRINLNNNKICDALTIYRCIKLPKYTCEDIHELIGVLLLHIQNRESRQQVSVVIEIEKVFESIISACNAEQLYSELSKIFWCGVALLRSDIARDYIGGITIVSKFLTKINLFSFDHHGQQQNKEQRSKYDMMLNHLHTFYPYSWNPMFPGLAILLLKGFCSKEQESESRKLMCKIISSNPCDIIDIDTQRAYVVFIISLLPHLLTFLGGENAVEISKLLCKALENQFLELSQIYKDYEVYRTSLEGLRRFLLEIVDKFTDIYFPTYESFVFTFLIGMLEKGPKQHHKTILQIMEAFLKKIDFSSSKLFSDELAIFTPILNFLQGDLWSPALNVLEVIFSRSSSTVVPPIKHDQIPLIRARIAQCQEISDYWNQLEQGKAVVFSALAKVIQSGDENEQFMAHKASMKPILATLKAPRVDSSSNLDDKSGSPKVSRKRKRKTKERTTTRNRSKKLKSVTSLSTSNESLPSPSENSPHSKIGEEENPVSSSPKKIPEKQSLPSPVKELSTPKLRVSGENPPSPLAFLRCPAPSIKNTDFHLLKNADDKSDNENLDQQVNADDLQQVNSEDLVNESKEEEIEEQFSSEEL